MPQQALKNCSRFAFVVSSDGLARKYSANVERHCFIRVKGAELFKAPQISCLTSRRVNLRIIQLIAKKLDMPVERVIVGTDDDKTSAVAAPEAFGGGSLGARL